MTSKERLVAALHGKPVDHIPFSPFLAYIWEHFPRDLQDQGPLAFHHRIGADPLWRGAPCAVKVIPPADMEVRNTEEKDRLTSEMVTPVGTLRQAWVRSQSGKTSFLVEHPLKTEKDFHIQLWIEEHTRLSYDPAPVEAHFSGEGREGLSLGALVPRGKSAFQSLVEHHVGTEELAYALADFPDTVERLWRAMVANDLAAVRLSAQSPYTYFISWEDSSTQNYSPAQYDAYIGSEIGEWCRMLAGCGKYYIQHACGHVAALVSRMKAQGVLAIESLSPPPTGNLEVRAARRMFGAEMGIIGGIEPTRFLQLSEAELKPYVETVMDAAQGGPFILANSDSCPPGVSIAKFEQVADLARRRTGSTRL